MYSKCIPLLILLIGMCVSLQQLPRLPLVPYPQYVRVQEDCQAFIDPRLFTFQSNSYSIVLGEAIARYSRYLRLHDYDQGHDVTLKTLQISIASANEVLNLDTSENYTLSVLANSASIQADTVFGAMRGLETFSQLVSTYNYSIPCVDIEDFPRYKFRGFMVDTSRHYLSVPVLKHLITAASWTKLNILHWHMVDDPSFPYCSTTYPELCKKGAYSPDHVYSQGDVLEVILHAYRHGVIVIPELDTPGHTLSWGNSLPGFLTHCPHHGNIGSDYGPIDPTNEAVYPVVRNLIKEVTTLFPSDFIHLGGDEVHYGCWKNNENINAWMTYHNISGDYEALERYYETKLLDIVSTLNTNYIVWEEVYKHKLAIKPQTIIHAWLPKWKDVFLNATSEGHRCILSACWYLNRISYGEDWRKFYQCDPRSPFNSTTPWDQQQLVLGGTVCMWGEYVDNTNVLHRSWPRASAPAERLWSAAEIKDPNFMEPRIEAHRCRMTFRGYPAEPSTKRGFCQKEFVWRH